MGIKKKLLQLDRLALLNIASVQRSTPTRGLAVLYDIVPLTNYLVSTRVGAYLRQMDLLGLEWSGSGKGVRHATSHRKYLSLIHI